MFKKIKLKQGADMVEFAIVLPALCLLIFSIIVIAQLCLCRQTMQYALYNSSRAAVVCENYETAKITMENVAKSSMQTSTFGIDPSDVQVELTLVSGTIANAGAPSSNNNIAWEKGALAECKITVRLDKMMKIGPDTMTSTIYVMVERPATAAHP